MGDSGLRNPFVIQCGECRKILTDSFTLHTIKNGHLVHSFSTVQEERERTVGIDAFDGCMVQDLKCTCGAVVGCYLLSVSEEWNGYAGMYAFRKEGVTSYMLGSVLSKEKCLYEVIDDVEKLKSVVSKIYKKVYQ
ncbi:hypothetical protein ENBRE01_1926 [Enteropsectra breve]|nr:hypothetical protein ENBRE01_1926 [Enteropsectra breve]